MALARCRLVITDEDGNIVDSASIEVRREAGLALEPLFSDRDGAVPIANPFTATDGRDAGFYCAAGAFKVTATKAALTVIHRHVAVGTAQEYEYVAGLEEGIKGVHNADIASAATLNLEPAAGELVDVTGTTAITAITLSDGHEATVRFTGALTLTHGASLVLPGAANILTVAGDYAIFRGYAAGVVRCVAYIRADGRALIAPIAPSQCAPQGRLTPTSATPVIAADVTAGTSLYYALYNGNLVPIYNGTAMIPTEFSELTLTLVASHAASQIYDVFVFSDSGTLRLVTGPAWTTPTAGAGARGTGAGTTELARIKGLWTNAASMTGRNGSSTYSIGANLATYLGSIFMDGTNGQLTCHTSFGQSRKFGIWNAYNRVPIILQAGDTTASWAYNTNTVRQSRATAGNTVAVFAGLAEESFECRFAQTVEANFSDASGACHIGIGVNSTTAFSGKTGASHADGTGNNILGLLAHHTVLPALGLQNINMLENTPVAGGASNQTFYGGNDDCLMTAKWAG